MPELQFMEAARRKLTGAFSSSGCFAGESSLYYANGDAPRTASVLKSASRRGMLTC